jgi:hypothetical protein
MPTFQEILAARKRGETVDLTPAPQQAQPTSAFAKALAARKRGEVVGAAPKPSQFAMLEGQSGRADQAFAPSAQEQAVADQFERNVHDNPDRWRGIARQVVANPTTFKTTFDSIPELDRPAFRKAIDIEAGVSAGAQVAEQAVGDVPVIRNPAMGAFQGLTDIAGLEQRARGNDTQAEAMARLAQGGEIVGEQRSPGALPRAVRGAARSMSVAVPAGIAGMAIPGAGPYLAILAGSGTSGNAAYQEALDKGLGQGEALSYAVDSALAEGLPEVVMQKVGLGGLEKVFGNQTRAARAGILSAMKEVGIDTAQELAGEYAAEFGQNLISKLHGVDPNALSAEQTLATLRDTTLQTIISMGATRAPRIAGGTYQTVSGEAANQRRAEWADKAMRTIDLYQRGQRGEMPIGGTLLDRFAREAANNSDYAATEQQLQGLTAQDVAAYGQGSPEDIARRQLGSTLGGATADAIGNIQAGQIAADPRVAQYRRDDYAARGQMDDAAKAAQRSAEEQGKADAALEQRADERLAEMLRRRKAGEMIPPQEFEQPAFAAGDVQVGPAPTFQQTDMALGVQAGEVVAEQTPPQEPQPQPIVQEQPDGKEEVQAEAPQAEVANAADRGTPDANRPVAGEPVDAAQARDGGQPLPQVVDEAGAAAGDAAPGVVEGVDEPSGNTGELDAAQVVAKADESPWDSTIDHLKAKIATLQPKADAPNTIPGSFITGSSGRSVSMSRRLDAENNRRANAFRELQQAKADLARWEARKAAWLAGEVNENGQPRADAPSRQAERKAADRIADFMRATLKVGGIVYNSGGNPVTIKRINPKSITSDSGVTWQYGELTPAGPDGKPMTPSETISAVKAFEAAQAEPTVSQTETQSSTLPTGIFALRRLARERGVDISDISGKGAAERIRARLSEQNERQIPASDAETIQAVTEPRQLQASTEEAAQAATKPRKRIISEEAYQRSRAEIRKAAQGGAPMSIEAAPRLLYHYAVNGAYHLENGIVKFSQWAKKMVAEFKADGLDPARWPNLAKLYEDLHKGGQFKGVYDLDEQTRAAMKVRAYNNNQWQGILRKAQDAQVMKAAKKATGIARPQEVRAAVREQFSPQGEEIVTTPEELLRYAMQHQAKGAAAGWKAGRADLQATQSELIAFAESNLPLSERAKVMRAIKNATTQRLRETVVEAVNRIQDNYEHRELRNQVVEALDEARRAKLLPEFQAKVDAAMSGVATKAMTDDTRRRLEAMQDYIEREKQEGRDIGIPPEVTSQLGRLSRRPLTELSMDELRMLADTVNMAVAVNKLKNKLIVKGQLRDIGESADAIQQQQEAIAPTERTSRSVVTGIEKDYSANKAKELFNEGMLDPDRLAMTHGDEFQQRIFQDVRDGRSAAKTGAWEFDDALRAATEKAGGKWGSRELMRMSEHTAKSAALLRPDLQTFTLESGQQIRLTSGLKIAMVLSARRPKLRKKLIDNGIHLEGHETGTAYRLTSEDLKMLSQSMTAMESAHAEAIFDFLNNKAASAVNKVSRLLVGREIANEGNYYMGHVSGMERQENLSELVMGFLPKMTLEDYGWLKPAVEHKVPMLIRDAYSDSYRHVDQVMKYAYLAMPIRNARAILGNPDIQKSITSRYGTQRLKAWEQFLVDAMDVDQQPGTFLTRTLQSLRSNYAKVKLTLNASTLAKQYLGVPALAAEFDMADLTKGAASAATTKGLDAEIDKWSGDLRERFHGDPAALGTAVFAGTSTRMLGRKHIADRLASLDWVGFQKQDRNVVKVAWQAAKAEIRRTRPELQGDEFMQAVAQRAEQVVHRTQNASDPLDLPGIARAARHDLMAAAIVMFKSQNNKMYNMQRQAVMDLRRAPKGSPKRANAVKALATTAVLIPAMNVIINSIFGKLRRGWFEEDDKGMADYATALLKEEMGVLYGGEELADVGVSLLRGKPKAPDIGPYMEGPLKVLDGISKMIRSTWADGAMKGGPDKGEDRSKVYMERGIKDAIFGTMETFGIPGEAPYNLARGIYRTANPSRPKKRRTTSAGRRRTSSSTRR